MPTWSSDEQRIMKELARTILKDGKPDNRKTALLDIRHFPDPRVLDLLQHVSQKDRNREVRDLAKNLHTKMRLEAETNPEQFAPPPRPALGSWSCDFCGATNSKDELTCPSCGASRRMPASLSAGSSSPIDASRVFLLDRRNHRFLTSKNPGRIYGDSPLTLIPVLVILIVFVSFMMLGSGSSLFLPFPGSVLGIGILGFSLLTGFQLVHAMQRHHHLARNGQVIQGELAASKSYTDSDNDYFIKLIYLFKSPEGKIMEGNYNQKRNDLRNKRLPERGTPVVILYASPTNYRLL